MDIDYSDFDEGNVEVDIMADCKVATCCAEFDSAHVELDGEFRKLLSQVRLNQVATWAYIVPAKVTEAGDMDEHLRSLLLGLNAGDNADTWTVEAKRLWEIARGERHDTAKRVGSLSGLQLSEDAVGRQLVWTTSRRRRRICADSTLPAEWRGKRCRRQARLANDHEREEAEAEERARWGREVAGLPVEANLPFAKSLGSAAPSSAVAQRCRKGLRAKTLKQRVSCWQPLRRWLLSVQDSTPDTVARPPYTVWLGSTAKG